MENREGREWRPLLRAQILRKQVAAVRLYCQIAAQKALPVLVEDLKSKPNSPTLPKDGYTHM